MGKRLNSFLRMDRDRIRKNKLNNLSSLVGAETMINKHSQTDIVNGFNGEDARKLGRANGRAAIDVWGLEVARKEFSEVIARRGGVMDDYDRGFKESLDAYDKQ